MVSNGILTLTAPELRGDLATYFGRAARIEDGSLRISAIGERVVALWVPVLRPAGILDDSPLVIAVRAIPATITDFSADDLRDGQFDAVVPLRGMLDRLARPLADGDAGLNIPIPPDRRNESWAGQRPPIAGWQSIAQLDAAALVEIAESGIDQIGTHFDGMLGQIRAERVRTETWTASIPESAITEWTGQPQPLPPAGAAFAAHALGFLPASGNTPASSTAADSRKPSLNNIPVRCAVAPGWWRIAFPAGQVLVRRKQLVT